MDSLNNVSETELLNRMVDKEKVLDVNAHLHTPYSFSAFDSIEQIFEMALVENVKVLGVNDFFTTKGYEKWAVNCQKNKMYPLFNIEFIGLSKIDQNKGIRINDPNNPGRIYISGKGMSYPFKLDEPYASQLKNVVNKSNSQSEAMCNMLNQHLQRKGIEIQLSFNTTLENLTEGMVRERHLAKALRMAIFEKAMAENDQKQLFGKLFNGKALKSEIDDFAGIENEIRSNLLKTGGAAFIEESPELFLDLETVRQLILNGGGIPTYPLLADSVNGGFTEFEADKERLLADIKAKGFYAVEFIPNRNTTAVLEEYCSYFVENGIAVSFGTEHNTPDLIPITIKTNEGIGLSDYLKKVNYDGACLIAAHQYLVANGKEGYLNKSGEPNVQNNQSLIDLGKAIIANATS